ncbi:hypothetical protein Cgig2_025781 [Carnegiea gigantea]|uniref:Uncharacterized protein n=1 Tax=Carnegiea gigantea TaxID=171969 RepID=A0A9Q1JIS7_9CARY|nr:hypothetical protein Cgig2_025781 [Carnegiea gigantea]
MSCKQCKLCAHWPQLEQQHPDQVLGESSTLPEIDEGEEGANPESGVSCVDDVVLARHTPVGKGISMALELLSGTMEVGTATLMDEIGNDMTIDPAMQSVEHGLSITPENTNVEGAAVEEACRTPESEMTMSADMKDVACKGDGVGKRSNIVTYIKRRLRCEKPAAVHGIPYIDPTQQLRARKRQKDINEGMMVAETACASSGPCEG